MLQIGSKMIVKFTSCALAENFKPLFTITYKNMKLAPISSIDNLVFSRILETSFFWRSAQYFLYAYTKKEAHKPVYCSWFTHNHKTLILMWVKLTQPWVNDAWYFQELLSVRVWAIKQISDKNELCIKLLRNAENSALLFL